MVVDTELFHIAHKLVDLYATNAVSSFHLYLLLPFPVLSFCCPLSVAVYGVTICLEKLKMSRNLRAVILSGKINFTLGATPFFDSALVVCNAVQKCTGVLRYYTAVTQIKLEKFALDGSVECCAPPPRWCDLEL